MLMDRACSSCKALSTRGITEPGCRAYSRRKFFDTRRSRRPGGQAALQHMGWRYAIEAALCELTLPANSVPHNRGHELTCVA